MTEHLKKVIDDAVDMLRHECPFRDDTPGYREWHERQRGIAANLLTIDPAAIRKAALQEAADVVRKFGEAMSRIGLHPDADSLSCDAASVALIGASSAILAL